MKASSNALRWILLAVIAISFAINYAGIFDPKMDTNGDNYQYYQLAHSLARGDGYVTDFEPVQTPHMHFPPGYPAFMAMFLKIFPDNIVALKILNGLLYLLSLILLFRIVRRSTGPAGLWIAFVSCLVCTFHPELLRWSTILMSEMLYMAVSFGIIAICQDLDFEKLRRKDWRQILLLVLLCLLVASTYFIRTMGVAVVLAAALAFAVLALRQLLKKQDKKSWIWPALTCLLVALSLFAAKTSWDIRNEHVIPGYKSDYLDTFVHKSASSDMMETFGDWTTRIGKNIKAFVSFYIPKSIFSTAKAVTTLPVPTVPVTALDWIGGILLILVMLAGLCSMKGLGVLTVSYVIINFGVLMLYQEQYAGVRYFIPVLPLLICALIAGTWAIVSYIAGRLGMKKASVAAYAAIIVLALVIIASSVKDQKIYRNYAATKSYKELPEYNPVREYIQACEYFKTAPEDFVVASRKPEIFYVHSGYHHCLMIPRSGTPEEVIQYLEDDHVDAVILDHWFRHAYMFVLPAIQKYPERFPLLEVIGRQDQPTAIFLFK